MTAEMVCRGPWGIPVAVRNAMCEDGRRRYVRITGRADTFFSIPGSVKVNGRTVTGFVSGDEDSGELKFTANKFGKNAKVMEAACWAQVRELALEVMA